MKRFMGTHRNRLDAKGRVSIPAPFRALLRDDGDSNGGMVLRPSHQYACIEVWPQATFDALAHPLDRLEMFSAAHDDLAAALYADAYLVESDKEGRIVLPESLVIHAALTDTVAFIGLGQYFQIWEPEAGAVRMRAARDGARVHTLPASAGAAR